MRARSKPPREPSLSSETLSSLGISPAARAARAVRQRPALLGVSLVVALLGSGWWWHRARAGVTDRDSDVEADAPIARAWSGFTLIPDAPPPATAAQQLEARLSTFARHVDRVRATIDPPLVDFGSDALREKIERIIARVDDRAQVSVHIRDLDSGRVLFDYYGDTLLNPASNHKLLTTSAALDLLGPD